MRLKILFILFLGFSIFAYIGCDRTTQPANPNQPPNTTMANIPVEYDTLYALVTLHWDGEDNDGYVTGYQYRYITYREFFNDTTYQDWVDTNVTSITLPFFSDDSISNHQWFQVRAVDNNGEHDPTPAEKELFTEKTEFPSTYILYPRNGNYYFASENPTDWWEGVQLDFYGTDLDGDIIEYGYKVDNGDTLWTTDTTVVIPPSMFEEPLTGPHTITVAARDNTFLVDPKGKSVTIELIFPTFEKPILIIDATSETNGSFPASIPQPTDEEVDQFYERIFPGSESWDLKEKGWPPPEVLGNYKMAVWHSDHIPFTKPHTIANYTDEIKDYMNIGGTMFISGWRILKSFAWDDPFPVQFPEGHFVNDYLHIVSVDETPIMGDCIGMLGIGENYSDIKIDSVKLAGFPYNGKLSYVNLIRTAAGFTDGIYSYNNDPQSSYYQYRGIRTGLRYYGTAFDAIILGFPMYFVEEESAKVMVQEILDQLEF